MVIYGKKYGKNMAYGKKTCFAKETILEKSIPVRDYCYTVTD